MTGNVFEYFKVTAFEVESLKLLKDDIRFNADYFLTSKNILFRDDIEFKPLSEFAKVIFPGIFKRILVENPKYGIPFITTSGMMENAPEPEKFLSLELTSNLDIYRVEEDWILVSRSGTIGNTVFTSKILTDFAVTEDALRVIPNNNNNVGFLYFYISSNYCKDVIVGKKGGAVIDHIYEEDLMSLPVPVVSQEITVELQEKYEKVKSNREQANDLLKEANRLVHEFNNLPALNISEANFFDNGKMIQSRILLSTKIIGEYRLDAHFYNPIAELSVKNITAFAENFLPLNQMAHSAYMGSRSSRNYVSKEFGVPFLSGKNIIQIRPPETKYVSRQETANLEEIVVKKGWILITRSGTLGRTVLVWNNFENHAASEHLIRVIPHEDEIDAGYLFAFLSSDYGYHQLIKCKHGAVIDEITEDQIGETIIPIPKDKLQKSIGDKVRLAYEKRAEAIRLEDESQDILKQSLTY